jgi:hypothetical protein
VDGSFHSLKRSRCRWLQVKVIKNEAKMKRLTYWFAGLLFLTIFCQGAWSQQPPSEAPPANVAGKWILYCNDPNGSSSSKYLDLQQDGNNIKGHFKGPNQSGGVEGTINGQHLVVRTKTRNVLVFRGRVDGQRVSGVVQGSTYNGTFHDGGGTGSFQGQRQE